MSGRFGNSVVILCIAAGIGSPAAAGADDVSMTISGPLRVLDGDTIEIGPLVLRLHGIDSPEANQSCDAAGGGSWPCGKVATDRLEEILADPALSCEPLDRDPYGRVIARCTVDGADIGSILVGEGLAWAFVEYSTDYVAVEAPARDRHIGIWQAPTQTAVDYRGNRWERAVADAPGGCPIKGNVSTSGERIYHTPWSPRYSATKIDEGKGERWFCDEASAQAAGWRAQRSR